MRAPLIAFVALISSCSEPTPAPVTPPPATPSPRSGELADEEAPRRERPAYRLVIHGGAGAPPRDLDPARRRAYVASMAAALRLGCGELERGAVSLDVVERVVSALESDPLFNAGRGAVMTREGTHELDASIMRGSDHGCGAVASVTTVEHPISLARAVMEHTRHVLLVGDGAEAFARERGIPAVDNGFFTTPRRREQWQARRDAGEHGTVGAVALDREGHLAAATSTGGLSDKRWGRVGDSPIVGAGTYADDATCAVSCTGTGEEFIRHGVARAISARMELADESVTMASEHVVLRTLAEGDGGVIALGADGDVAMVYSTGGMFRGSCGPEGELEVRIWEGAEPIEGPNTAE